MQQAKQMRLGAETDGGFASAGPSLVAMSPQEFGRLLLDEHGLLIGRPAPSGWLTKASDGSKADG